jgi:Protein of unknown function (DUF3572)
MKSNRRTGAGKLDLAGRQEAAGALAAAALGYLASDPEQLSRFLALTGIDPGSVRSAAGEPGFLAGVLEYMSGDERVLVAFAAHAGVAPAEIETARQALAGDHWERDLP